MYHKDDAWSFMEGLDIDVLPVLKRRGFSGLQAAYWSVPSPSFSSAQPGR